MSVSQRGQAPGICLAAVVQGAAHVFGLLGMVYAVCVQDSAAVSVAQGGQAPGICMAAAVVPVAADVFGLLGIAFAVCVQDSAAAVSVAAWPAARYLVGNSSGSMLWMFLGLGRVRSGMSGRM